MYKQPDTEALSQTPSGQCLKMYYVQQYLFLSLSWSTQASDDPDDLTCVLSLRNGPVVSVLGFRPASVSHDLMVITFHV